VQRVSLQAMSQCEVPGHVFVSVSGGWQAEDYNASQGKHNSCQDAQGRAVQPQLLPWRVHTD
jgi:hypothetical protein